MDTTVDSDVVPELSHDQSTVSSDTDETHSLEGIYSNRSLSETSPSRWLEYDTGKAQTLNDDALFSQYLRSPFPSHTHVEEDGSDRDKQISIPPQTTNPREICLAAERDSHLTDLIDEIFLPPAFNQSRTRSLALRFVSVIQNLYPSLKSPSD